MTSRDFCFWLQGFFELRADPGHEAGLTIEQADMVKRHLALVFRHEIDPSMGDAKQQSGLNAIHDAPPFLGGAASHLTAQNDGPIKYRC